MKLATLVLVSLLSTAFSAPVVIAHRGASGYLPEHTLEAKALAYAMGADFLEQDLVLSKDDVPVVLHDIHIDTVTDVAKRFPGRQREDGRFYALDFTLAELRELRVTERIDPKTRKAVNPTRFPPGKSSFQIPTFEEELEFIAGLNQSTGRSVGIYPELKQPAWHLKQGRDLSRVVLAILRRHGYAKKSDACWLQCFEFPELQRVRSELGWEGRLLLLLGGKKAGDGKWLGEPPGLDEVAKIADGIGPSLGSIVVGKSPDDRAVTPLVSNAHARKLVVHPYTVRADDLPKTVRSIEDLHRLLFVEAGIDGVFTDFPDQTHRFLTAPR